MHFSLKNMLFSFAAGLVVFSLLMVWVCSDYFNSEVKVALSDKTPAATSSDKYNLHEAVVFKSCDNNGLDFAVLVIVDTHNDKMLFSRLSGNYLMNYRDSMSYISNVYDSVGDTALVELVKAVSGISVNKVIPLDGSVAYDKVVDEIQKLFEADSALFADTFNTEADALGFDMIEFPIVTSIIQTENTHENIVVIDTEKTVNKFKTTFVIK